MIEAELPDGRILEFPDGTDPSVIQNTVRRVLRAGNVPPIPEPRGIPQQRRGTMQGLAEVAASALDIAPFGLGAEAGAVTQSLLGQAGVGGFSPSLSENIERNRRILEQADPTARTVGQVAGAVPSGFAFAAPASVGQAARQGAVLGAGFGAGVTEGGLPERAVGAVTGAAAGGAAGAAGQALIQGISRAIANRRTGLDAPTRRALDRALAQAEAGDITPQQLANRVERLGPEGMLADVPEMQPLAGAVATRSAAGTRVAEAAIRGRRAAAGQRVDEALDIALAGRNTREARNAILSARQEQADDLYRQALAVGELQRTPALEDLIGRPTEEGIEGGSRLVRRQLNQIREANPRFRDLPDTDPNLLHAVRVQLGERTRRPGAASRNINDVVQQLTDAMDQAGATGYRQAVDQYRGDSLMVEAFDQGRQALNALPEDVGLFLQNATPGERDSFVAGLGREVVRRLSEGETGAASRGVRSVLSGERADVLRETLGDEAYDQLRNRLLREIQFAGTETRVLRGSQTQPREAAEQQAQERLGRLRRGVEAIRGGRGSQAALLEQFLGSRAPASQVAEDRALAQILFRSQGQGLAPGRFESRSPLVELALRQSLLRGGGRLTAPARQPSVGLAGGLAAQAAANNPLLGQSGF